MKKLLIFCTFCFLLFESCRSSSGPNSKSRPAALNSDSKAPITSNTAPKPDVSNISENTSSNENPHSNFYSPGEAQTFPEIPMQNPNPDPSSFSQTFINSPPAQILPDFNISSSDIVGPSAPQVTPQEPVTSPSNNSDSNISPASNTQISPDLPPQDFSASSAQNPSPSSDSNLAPPQQVSGLPLGVENVPANCPRKNVNFEKQLPPPKHQDGMGICYSFAGAEVLNQHLYLSQGQDLDPPQKMDFTKTEYSVSPSSLASLEGYRMRREHPSLIEYDYATLTSNYRSSQPYMIGGVTIPTLRHAIGRNPQYPDAKFCFEKDFKSEVYMMNGADTDVNYCLQNISQWRGLTDQIIAAMNQASKIPSSAGPCQLRFQQNKRPKLVSYCVEKTPEYKRDSSGQQYVEVLCDESATKLRDSRELLAKMDEALSSGRVVQTDYNDDVLKNPNMLNIPRQDPDHATVVIGRNVNPKTCRAEYIIRDSQTLRCSPHKLQTGVQQGHIRCERSSSGRGILLFVDESFFAKHLVSMNFIQN